MKKDWINSSWWDRADGSTKFAYLALAGCLLFGVIFSIVTAILN